jgi:FixJ family two-component response regulator
MSPHILRERVQPAPMAEVRPIVFVVDDDISVRESLELLIRSEGLHVETFESAQGFLARPRPIVPSCVVLDVSLPGLSGLDLQRSIATERRKMPIIFITGHGDIPMSVQAMKAGAVEFLTKPFNDHALLGAVKSALGQSQAALETEREMQVLQEHYQSLTPREREVMALVVCGLLNKQIGFELGISEITVKAHRGKVMHKMKAGSVAELVRMASSLGSGRVASLYQ